LGANGGVTTEQETLSADDNGVRVWRREWLVPEGREHWRHWCGGLLDSVGYGDNYHGREWLLGVRIVRRGGTVEEQGGSVSWF